MALQHATSAIGKMTDRLRDIHELRNQLEETRRRAEDDLFKASLGDTLPSHVSDAAPAPRTYTSYQSPARRSPARKETYEHAGRSHVGNVLDDLDVSASSGMSALGTTTTSISTNSKAVLSALRALQDKIRRLEGERAKLDADVARLTGELAMTKDAAARAALDAVSRSEGEKAELQRTITQLRTELSEFREQANSQRNEMGVAHRAEVQELVDMLDRVRKENTELRSSVARKESELETQSQSLEHHRGRIVALKDMSAAAEQRAEAQAKAAEERIARVTSQAAERVSASDAQLEAMRRERNDAISECDAMRREVEELRGVCASREENVAALRARVHSLSELSQNLVDTLPGSPKRRSGGGGGGSMSPQLTHPQSHLDRDASGGGMFDQGFGFRAVGGSEGGGAEEGEGGDAGGMGGFEVPMPSNGRPGALFQRVTQRAALRSKPTHDNGSSDGIGGERPSSRSHSRSRGTASAAATATAHPGSGSERSGLPRPHSAHSRSSRVQAAAAARHSVHEQLRESYGDATGALPFVLGAGKGPSHSVVANVQMSMAPPTAHGLSRPILLPEGQLSGQAAMYASGSYGPQTTPHSSSGGGASTRLRAPPSPVWSKVGTTTSAGGGGGESGSGGGGRGRSSEGRLAQTQRSSSSSGGGGGRRGSVEGSRVAAVDEAHMAQLLHSLEGEYEQLEQQYQALRSAASERGPGGPELETAATSVLIALHNKRQQIDVLQSSQPATMGGVLRSPVRNPAAAEKRIDAMRTLAHLKELAHEAGHWGPDDYAARRRKGGSSTGAGATA